EGVYGVSQVASNGRGFSTPPRAGETPDYWIEVDLTRPTVELTSVQPGVGADAKAVVIQWQAQDKNLTDGPVDLYYSQNREGPWTAIARGVKNDGRYRWTVPPQAGPNAYVRVVVTDRAGNVCQCETLNAVVLDDLSRPRVHITGVVRPSGN